MQLKPNLPRSVLDRTLDNLASGWNKISHLGNSGNLKLHPDLPDTDLKQLRIQLQDCLESKGGEVSSRARAAGLGHAYLTLDDQGRYRFFKLLVDEFGIDSQELKSTMQEFLENPENQHLLDVIRTHLRPPWIKLFTQFNALPSGIKFLVDMRADILRISADQPGLESINKDLQNLLISWFDIGFLDLKRITWNEPAALLEKLVEYESVHEIRSWLDLKNRLDIDRCCYAFFHPRMPDEPLIFVQVALVKGISTNVTELLDNTAPVQDPDNADTAIFYSISNTQLGLRGVSLGDFLIKRVVDNLTKVFPNLKTFSTLSPIPAFKDFIVRNVENEDTTLISDEDKNKLRPLISSDTALDKNIEKLEAAEPLLTKLCAHYLINEKRGKGAKDSVANFHLTNGARIEQINWLGDTSEQGMKRSFGLMVNYLYKTTDIETNHEAYAGQGEIRCSSVVKSLLK